MKVKSQQKQGRLFFLPGILLIFLLLPLLALAWYLPAGSEAKPPDLEIYPWAYLRDGQPMAPGERTASVIAVGDMMPGRGVAAVADPWGEVAGWLQAADLTIGNLESVLVDGGNPHQGLNGEAQPIVLSGSPAAASLLRQAGFDIVGVANNHSLDFGERGLQESTGHLQRAGLEIAGSTTDKGEIAALYQTVDGVRLAFLAFNAVPDPHPSEACSSGKNCSVQPARWDPLEAAAAIALAKSQAAAVIVSIHWGFEYELWQDPGQEKAAQIILAAGADLILGHHPHVAQPIVVNGEQVTAYSLGNFVFDQGAAETRQGLALRAFFDEGGLRAVQVLPVESGHRPRLLSPGEGASLMARVLPPPPRVGFACDVAGCMPADVPQTGQTGLFYAGQIDLTGDGTPETVRREGERITIYEKGMPAWQSPAEWRVVDVALGDPNDDGRFEVMLAIWRKDGAGYERSQPYILGYRGGHYTLLWGGRPVVDPIQELAVGDVDGDGSDELVVIEEKADGSAQAVSVWRWTGWTFSLAWRSPYGRYGDLILGEGNQAVISAVLTRSK